MTAQERDAHDRILRWCRRNGRVPSQKESAVNNVMRVLRGGRYAIMDVAHGGPAIASGATWVEVEARLQDLGANLG